MIETGRLFKRLLDAWHEIAGSGSVSGGVSPDLSSDGDIKRLRGQMAACLEARGGEVSARVRAAALGRTYLELDAEGRRRFLGIVAGGFGPDPAAIDDAIAALQAAEPAERPAAQDRLRRALESPRLRLMTQFNGLPEGVKFLVDLRADLNGLSDEPGLKALNDDLRDLLASWFDERPDEPQLPLYAVTSKGKIAALAFGRIKRGKSTFIGLSESEGILPGVKTISDSRYTQDINDWDALLVQWQNTLSELAIAFQAGDARVDPKSTTTCRYCDLHTFCRIYEIKSRTSYVEEVVEEGNVE